MLLILLAGEVEVFRWWFPANRQTFGTQFQWFHEWTHTKFLDSGSFAISLNTASFRKSTKFVFYPLLITCSSANETKAENTIRCLQFGSLSISGCSSRFSPHTRGLEWPNARNQKPNKKSWRKSTHRMVRCTKLRARKLRGGVPLAMVRFYRWVYYTHDATWRKFFCSPKCRVKVGWMLYNCSKHTGFGL